MAKQNNELSDKQIVNRLRKYYPMMLDNLLMEWRKQDRRRVKK
jgi:hypothetical protein